MANCERDGHVWNAAGHCVMCKEPKPRAPTGLHSCPFCGSFDIKLFKGGETEYAQCMGCTACGPDHVNGHHWNKLVLRLPPEGCHCPPDRCMAPTIMGKQMPCLRREVPQPENPNA